MPWSVSKTVIADGYEYAPESEPLSSQELECLNTCLIAARVLEETVNDYHLNQKP